MKKYLVWRDGCQKTIMLLSEADALKKLRAGYHVVEVK